jgi:peptidyl-prolyl cis-trans isomerase B (cyclophilin B)
MFRQATFLALISVSILMAPLAEAATEEVAVVSTPAGDIVWRFFAAEAPGHTNYVKELIREGFYDGTTIHRVLPHFVIQGGDPNSRNEDRADDGSGQADRTLKAEFSQSLHYRPGTVGMARDSDPDSGSCQFFIALESLPRLDGRYTIFAEVIEGLDIAREIALSPRDFNDNPLSKVTVTARLEMRDLPPTFLSSEAGESGETITGPGRPKMYDPGNNLWSPLKMLGQSDLPGSARLDLTVQEDGAVQDVRFVDWQTPGAKRLIESAMGWRFSPPTFDGKARKLRMEINADGSGLRAPTNYFAPREVTADIIAPGPAVRVELPAGKEAPEKTTRIRMTVDGSGEVSEAWLQESCGDEKLDAAAVEAARKMVFKPATRPSTSGGDPDPLSVYLDVEARYVTVEMDPVAATQ